MLHLIEPYTSDIYAVTDNTSAVAVLQKICDGLGFRSAHILVLSDDLQAVTDATIDTFPERRLARLELLGNFGILPAVEAVKKMLEIDAVLQIGPEWLDEDHPYLTFWTTYDLEDSWAVPLNLGETIAGVASFSGRPDLTTEEKFAIQVLSYSLFSQIRPRAPVAPSIPRITPRETEVMRLASVGLTSSEVADELGMSARTVNQHVENVALKLGTRNRTHTIAELVRSGALG